VSDTPTETVTIGRIPGQAIGLSCTIEIAIPMETLRDWFAGQALQGRAHRLSNPYNDRDILASDCYEIADAMIAARKGGTDGDR
jgi:hypothetical protein